MKPQQVFALQRRYPSAHVTVCERRVSQAVYEQFLSPSCAPIGAVKSLLELVHASTGLPWWASLAITTAALRTVLTFPLMVYSMNNRAKLERLQPEIKSISKDMAAEVAAAQQMYEWDSNTAKNQYEINMKRHIQRLILRDNCHPLKEYILPWIQIPLWISMSIALRNMSGSMILDNKQLPVLCHEMSTEGTLWFTNLLVPDTTLILPVTVCLLNLAIIELHGLRVLKPTRFHRLLSYVMRGAVLLMIPIGSMVPSCMCLYWTYSSFYGLMQFILLRLPTVRRILHINASSTDTDTPFRDLWHLARRKYRLRDKVAK